MHILSELQMRALARPHPKISRTWIFSKETFSYELHYLGRDEILEPLLDGDSFSLLLLILLSYVN